MVIGHNLSEVRKNRAIEVNERWGCKGLGRGKWLNLENKNIDLAIGKGRNVLIVGRCWKIWNYFSKIGHRASPILLPAELVEMPIPGSSPATTDLDSQGKLCEVLPRLYCCTPTLWNQTQYPWNWKSMECHLMWISNLKRDTLEHMDEGQLLHKVTRVSIHSN